MSKKSAAEVKRFLDKNFPLKTTEIKTGLKYPKKNKFALLVAVILSSNTTDKQVNNVTKELFKYANKSKAMLKLGRSKIRSIIMSAGLAERKSKYIISLSKELISKYNGRVPMNKKDLLKLPGVGNKVAGVFLINAGGEPDFPVDTHVKKCAIKWKLTKETNAIKISLDLKKLFNKKDWAKIHYQMIHASRSGTCKKMNFLAICNTLFTKDHKTLKI